MFNDEKDKEWVWCLVGNIVESHKYGESKERMTGTKHFRPGAKVFMAPANWGDGYEKIVVIGCPRHKKNYIEIIMRSEYTENHRIQKIYQPSILKMMEKSSHLWWDESEDSYERINILINSLGKRKTDS